MTKKDFPLSIAFCNRYGNQVVKALKRRAPWETGSLRADITYKITFYAQSFNLTFYIDDHIMPVDSNLLPSEYGNILDKKDYTDKHSHKSTKYWFSAPIPGLDQNYFITNLEIAMVKDIENYLLKDL